MIAFAGRPYVVSPMTLDHDWLLQNLERVRIGLVEDGTAIGSAMASAANRLTDKTVEEPRHRSVDRWRKQLREKFRRTPRPKRSRRCGSASYAIGAGINGVAPVPVFDRRTDGRDGRLAGNIMYQNQQVQFNEAGLKEVAQIAGGQFFRATDTESLERHLSRHRQDGEVDCHR